MNVSSGFCISIYMFRVMNMYIFMYMQYDWEHVIGISMFNMFMDMYIDMYAHMDMNVHMSSGFYCKQ